MKPVRSLATSDDFKPDNYIIAPHPDNPKEFVFGIAKCVGSYGIVYKPVGHECPLAAATYDEIRGVPLTEELLKKVRRDFGLRGKDKDYSSIEFSCHPPGERQVDNNYYSNEIDLDRYHLSPSRHWDYPEGFGEGKPGIKREVPELWHIWIESYGTGSNWFMGVTDIHRYPLRYLHQLQNIFYFGSGYKLFVKAETLVKFENLFTIENKGPDIIS